MKRRHYILTTLLLLPTLLTVIYLIVFRNYTEAAYHDQAPGWFNDFIQWFYPRFAAEKNRLPLSFFLNKTDQIVIRTWITFGGMALVYGLTHFRAMSAEKWHQYWSKTISIKNSQLLRTIYSISLILVFWDIYTDLAAIDGLAPFYQPTFIYRILHLPLPSSTVLIVLYSVMMLGLIMTIFNVKPIISFSIAFVLFLYLQGIFYCFEKIDHGYVIFTYGGFMIWIMVFIEQKGIIKKLKEIPNWPIVLAQVFIALTYFQAGMEKLLTSGFQWASASTFKNYLVAHQTDLGILVSQSDLLCSLLAIGALLFQVTFPIVLFQRRLVVFYLIAGILFHWGTTILLGVSTWLNPWIFAYLFFINLRLLPNKVLLKKNLKRISH